MVRAVWNLGGGLYPGAPTPNPRCLKNYEKGTWTLRFTKRAGYGSPCLYLEFWMLRQEALWFDISLEDSMFQMSLDYMVTSAKDKHLSSSPPPHPKSKTTINKKQSRETRSVFQTDLKVPSGGKTQDVGHILGCW